MKNKAKELVDKYIGMNHQHSLDTGEEYGNSYSYHKKCALLEVEGRKEQLNSMADYLDVTNGEWYSEELAKLTELKEEINNL